ENGGGNTGTGGQSNTSVTTFPETNTPGVAITILSPTQPPLATSTPITENSGTGGETGPSATPGQFVTPNSPLGPVTPDTPVPFQNPPTATPSGLVTPTALAGAASARGCAHTVQPGDTLFRIATKNNITLAELRSANPQISGDLIQPGDVLNIPGCTANPNGGSVQPTSAPAEQPTLAAPGGGTVYTVQKGDTLF